MKASPTDPEDGQERQLAPGDAQRLGRMIATATTSPIAAPVIRTSVSRSDESPDESVTFATTPLTANSVAAVSTIA